MDAPPVECLVWHVIISPSKIHYLRFVLEAYDGIAVVTTIDSALGLVRLAVAPGCEEDVRRILDSEGALLHLRHVSVDPLSSPS